jgi:hypothetical protein
MATDVSAVTPGYPARYGVEYPQELSRWLPFVKWLLAIPHFFVLYVLSIVASTIVFVTFFVILFTKRCPKELFDFVVNYHRWNQNVLSYVSLMRDEYPPFSWDAGKYPVTVEFDYPEELSRWLPLVKWLLAIPHYLVLTLLWIGLSVALIIAFFAILFTKKYPESFFRYCEGVLRWSLRVNAYVYLMRDEYPPFSLDA